MQSDLYQGSSLSPELALSVNTHLVCVGVSHVPLSGALFYLCEPPGPHSRYETAPASARLESL